tara:strand:- start:1627 stop:2442 length:816 start_codon:yes stop_codon:yes gene_type:complete
MIFMIRKLLLSILPTLLFLPATAEQDDRADGTFKEIISADPDVHPNLKKMIKERLAKYPKDYKAKLVFGKFQREDYLYSIAILDAEGKYDGLEEFWRPWSWAVIRSVEWKNGAKNGIEKVFKDGKVESEILWKNGKVHGTRKSFHSNGKLRSETIWENGLANGPSRIYDATGRLQREANMKNGKRDGLQTYYWLRTDTPKRIINYKMGKVDGQGKEFYTNGKIKREMNFKNDELHGKDTEYDLRGKVVRLQFWFGGDKVSRKELKLKLKSR